MINKIINMISRYSRPRRMVMVAFAILIIYCIFYFDYSSFRATAQDTETPNTQDSDSPESLECVSKMRQYLPVKQKEFLTYVNDTFKSEGGNSSKISEVIDKYTELKNEIYNTYLEYSAAKTGEEVLSATVKPSNCYILVEDSFTALEEIIKTNAISTNSSKVTSKLSEKYKEINGKLSGLNKSVGRMKGYIDAFEAKLPCYIEKCVK